MNQCGLILADEEGSKNTVVKFLDRIIPQNLVNIFLLNIKKCQYYSVHKRLRNSEINIFILKVPYNWHRLDSFSRPMMKKVLNRIKEMLILNNIKYIIVAGNKNIHTEYMKDFFSENGFVITDGKILLSCLSIDILKKMLKVMDVDIRDVSVGIIDKQLTEKSKFLMNALSSYVKYITIVTQSLQKAQEYAEDIFDNTGLSIRISDISLMKRKFCNVLFVVDDIDEMTLRKITNHKTIVFCLQGHLSNKINYGTLIDSINIALPEKIFEEGNNLKNFEYSKMIEAVILSGINKEIDDLKAEDYWKIRSEFYKLNCKISVLKYSEKTIKIN